VKVGANSLITNERTVGNSLDDQDLDPASSIYRRWSKPVTLCQRLDLESCCLGHPVSLKLTNLFLQVFSLYRDLVAIEPVPYIAFATSEWADFDNLSNEAKRYVYRFERLHENLNRY